MQTDKIKKIEEFAKSLELNEAGHGLAHTERVMKWGLLIAKKESYEQTDLVIAAALLHDIGLSRKGDRRNHGNISAEMARGFLSEEELFKASEIEEICEAISLHNQKVPRTSKLSAILMDADILDLLGPIGIIRACTSRAYLPEYDPLNIKSLAWKAHNDFYDERFAKGGSIQLNLTEQINFQASCYDNLTFESSKKIARAQADYLYKFILDLEEQLKIIL